VSGVRRGGGESHNVGNQRGQKTKRGGGGELSETPVVQRGKKSNSVGLSGVSKKQCCKRKGGVHPEGGKKRSSRREVTKQKALKRRKKDKTREARFWSPGETGERGIHQCSGGKSR